MPKAAAKEKAPAKKTAAKKTPTKAKPAKKEKDPNAPKVCVVGTHLAQQQQPATSAGQQAGLCSLQLQQPPACHTS